MTPPPRKRSPRRVALGCSIMLIVAAAVVIIVAALSDGGTPTAAPPSTLTPTTKTGSSSEPTVKSDGLTRYGATVDAWNGAHTADAEFAPGSVYDADPSLPQVNGHTGAKYTVVTAMAGRITSYDVNFLPMSLSRAESLIAGEFPPDATVLWTQKLDTCVQVEYASPTLRGALGHTQAGDVYVEFDDVQPDGSTASSPVQFNEAIVMDLPGAQPDPSFGC